MLPTEVEHDRNTWTGFEAAAQSTMENVVAIIMREDKFRVKTG